MCGSATAVACALRDLDLRDRRNLGAVEVPTGVIHSNRAIQLQSRPIMFLSEDRPIEFSLREPKQFRFEVYMMSVETAHQNVGASSAQLSIAVNDTRIELVISGGELCAEVHSGREVRRKSGVKTFYAEIAELTPMIGNHLPLIVFGKRAKGIGDLYVNTPTGV